MYIRKAIVEDVPYICDLYWQSSAYYGLKEIELDEESVYSFVEDESRHTYVAIDDDLETVIGVVTAHKEETYYGYDTVWMDGLITDPNTRCGGPLVESVLEYAKSENVHRVYSVTDQLEQSEVFFKRKGFETKGLLLGLGIG